jgi:hypothetical protein
MISRACSPCILLACVLLVLSGAPRAAAQVQSPSIAGYRLEQDKVVFVFQPNLYKECIGSDGFIKRMQSLQITNVTVACEINAWSVKDWPMKKINEYWYELRVPASTFATNNPCQFAFVLNGVYWVQPAKEMKNIGDAQSISISIFGLHKKRRYSLVLSLPQSSAQVQTFRLEGYAQAREVFLAGSFNHWDTRATPLSRKGNEWKTELLLNPGGYSYKFIVDGAWMTDPANPVTVEDGGGHTNSYMLIPALHGSTEFSVRGFPQAKRIAVAGSFNGWNPEQYFFARQDAKGSAEWKCRLNLRPGLYEYRFIVDGQWMQDSANPNATPNEFNEFNSVLLLPSTEGNVEFTLKGYEKAKVVALAGTFNGWSERRTLFAWNKKIGAWVCRITLKPGQYQYKFIVDGTWMLDPANKLVVPNEFGTGNNQMTVK